VAWSRRRKIWVSVIAAGALACVVALSIAVSIFSKRFEPFLREQAVQYLRTRFESDVELAALRLHMPKLSPLKLWKSRGRGSMARVEGEGISMRWHGDRSRPPLFSIRRFAFEVDVGSVWERRPVVHTVELDGMEIHIPPKEDRPRVQAGGSGGPKVLIEGVRIRNARLVVLPRDPNKKPLEFQIAQLRLDSTGGPAMRYQAQLTNPKPPGHIESNGSFGPWNADEPGDTPLSGQYDFRNADLGVFLGIAGTLHSTGEFQGTLDSINARGEAYIPDFRLKMAGNPVPLRTRFEVLVDGTNGNTVLQPVRATLGSTQFTTSGAIIKHEGHERRTISLNVSMPNGNITDLLRLATKGAPFMEGRVALKTRLDIPPLSGRVREKLRLDGNFDMSDGRFLRSNIQDQLDNLSRRGQGQPKNEAIDEVLSGMRGRFHLEGEVLSFSRLSFEVPGANVDLAGKYKLDDDTLDFRGSLRLSAKVSQTMTGWKRWALKPVDPFFAKNGAGTFLRVKVEGSAKQPQFGLDRSRKEAPSTEETRARKAQPDPVRR
jgi:AsmA-like C-terminal region